MFDYGTHFENQNSALRSVNPQRQYQSTFSFKTSQPSALRPVNHQLSVRPVYIQLFVFVL